MTEWIFAHMKSVFVLLGIAAIALIGFAVMGSINDGRANARCIGVVTDKYNEYEPGVTINTGSSGVGIPTGSTHYFLAIKMSDGKFCSRKVSKGTWLSVQRGETYSG